MHKYSVIKTPTKDRKSFYAEICCYLMPKCTLATKTGCHGIAENFYKWHKALLKQIRLQ